MRQLSRLAQGDLPEVVRLRDREAVRPGKSRILGEFVSVTGITASMRSACFGLGTIGHNRGASGTPGLHPHTTFAVTGDGVPLGVVSLDFDAPDGRPDQGRPVEERKTGRWLSGLRHGIAAAKEPDGVKAVAVMDPKGTCWTCSTNTVLRAAADWRCWCGHGMTAASARRHPRRRPGPATWWRPTISLTKSRVG